MQSSAGSKHSSARSVVGEWRHDKVIAEWFSGVQERKSKVGSKVYKQAVQVLSCWRGPFRPLGSDNTIHRAKV
jgi:hypothetical protein